MCHSDFGCVSIIILHLHGIFLSHIFSNNSLFLSIPISYPTLFSLSALEVSYIQVQCQIQVLNSEENMFKSGRWRSKNKFKSVFMLQFQATEVPRSKKSSGVSISLVPEDVGKPTVKLEKAPIVEGTCIWENPIYETVKLIREQKTGKIKEKIYHFIVSTGSSKSGFLGEASIDFADFAMETEALTVSLPLKFANSGAVLHVTILKMEGGPEDQREAEATEAVTVEHESSLKHQLSNCSSDGNYDFTQEELLDKSLAENGTFRASTALSEHNSIPNKGAVDSNISKRSNTDWSVGSASDGSLVDSSNSLEDNAGDEKLKGEIAVLMRQASVSELELQTVRRQVVKETKRGQILSSEILSIKDERDLLKNECQQLKSLQKVQRQFESENQDLKDLLREIKKELDHEEDMNADLRMQLQKTQDSNAELILEVRELSEMLEQKNKEIDCMSRKIEEASRNVEDVHVTNCKCNKNKDEYSDNEEREALKQKITDLSGEIDVYRKHKDNLAIYVEQLTVENEILKQEKKADEPLQSESSGFAAIQHELESQVERLEEQIERQAQQLSESMLSINELESEVKELEKQAQGFEEELDNTTRAKLQQEQRAIRAEDALRKARWNNTATADKLQEEFKKISMEMESKLDENEKLTAKAVAESSELQQQKRVLEEMLHKANKELGRIKDQYEAQLQNLSNQIDLKAKEIDQMSLELADKSKQLEYVKVHEQEKQDAYSKEIQLLRTELQRRGETDEIKTSTSEAEILTQKWNKEREDLDMKFGSARMEAEKLKEELLNMRSNKDENERLIRKLQSEKQNIRTQYSRLKDRLQEDDLEKENTKKQVIQLKDELRKKESEITRIEKKLKDSSMQTTASEASMTSLKKKFKLLEEQVKLKESGLETARSSYLEKETNLSNTIKKLENKMEQLKQSQRRSADAMTKEARCVGRTNDSMGQSLLHSEKSEREVQHKVSNIVSTGNDKRKITELLAELTLLKERNQSMESDLKDMQERYTEISLRFAEVEGERQQLVMTVRNLKNGKKN